MRHRPEEAGFEVLVEIDNITPPTTTFAQLEQDDRADDRTDRFGGYADSASAKGSAMVEQVDAERQRIPLDQPHLIGHHSYNRTVRAEEKRNAKEQRGLEHVRRGRRWAGRADAAAGFQTGRQALGTTLRRIERLEAEIRSHTRYLKGTIRQWEITVTTDWTGDYGKTLDERLAARPQGAHVVSRDEDRNLARVFIPLSPTARAVTETQIILLGEEVDHWKTHVAALQEKEGKKVWSSRTSRAVTSSRSASAGTRSYGSTPRP
ncbi:MAG: hypothetical protein JWN00_3151 [Actinomycetia bacterium]|nr:hypothetical protein [Actinomycetes bacterium]